MSEGNEVKRVTASELEEQIFDKEGVRIVIRSGKEERFPPYSYKNKASATMSKNTWYMSRVKPLLGDKEGEIIDGTGDIPHGRTQMKNMRDSYK
ncbi:MAG: hypothetical protein K0R92_363 [Lachnospiraceae bacterium]|jgi:hypothetical protein|nr:hypothetical protein [Lachnospiraceae bacterium]